MLVVFLWSKKRKREYYVDRTMIDSPSGLKVFHTEFDPLGYFLIVKPCSVQPWWTHDRGMWEKNKKSQMAAKEEIEGRGGEAVLLERLWMEDGCWNVIEI